jgi:hypothetical protein
MHVSKHMFRVSRPIHQNFVAGLYVFSPRVRSRTPCSMVVQTNGVGHFQDSFLPSWNLHRVDRLGSGRRPILIWRCGQPNKCHPLWNVHPVRVPGRHYRQFVATQVIYDDRQFGVPSLRGRTVVLRSNRQHLVSSLRRCHAGHSLWSSGNLLQYDFFRISRRAPERIGMLISFFHPIGPDTDRDILVHMHAMDDSFRWCKCWCSRCSRCQHRPDPTRWCSNICFCCLHYHSV